MWLVRPVWVLQNLGVNMELLKIKYGNIGTDLDKEYYNYRDHRGSIQIFTGGSKYAGSAVALLIIKWAFDKREYDC